MTTTPANAIHQPRNFDPTQYEFIDCFDSAPDFPDRRMVWDEELGREVSRQGQLTRMLRNSPTSRWDERGQCDHCGARIRYVAVLKHSSGDYMAVGETCLDTRMGCADQASFRFRFIRDAATNHRLHMERLARQAEFVAAHPECAILVDYQGDNEFFASLSQQLLRNGSLTERQVAAIERSAQRDAERAAREAERAAEPKVPAPEGKVTVTGEVVGLKWHENDFGGCLKMTVKDDRGFCVWATAPAALTNLERGDRITFSATLTRSDRDESFAFGKRPTKAAYLPAQ